MIAIHPRFSLETVLRESDAVVDHALAEGVRLNGDALVRYVNATRHELALASERLRSFRGRFGIPAFNPLSEPECAMFLNRFGCRPTSLKSRTLRRCACQGADLLADVRSARISLTTLERVTVFTRRRMLKGVRRIPAAKTARLVIIDFAIPHLSRKYRSIVSTRPGYVFVNADYKSYEMWILADLTKDPDLTEMLTSTEDFYSQVQAALETSEPALRSVLDRPTIKVATLAIAYGMTTWGLEDKLGCEPETADALLGAMKSLFTNAEEYLDHRATTAKEEFHITARSGIRRNWGPGDDREEIYRQARNHLVQAEAAVVFRERLVALHHLLEKHGWGRICIPLHDGILFEIAEDSVSEAIPAIRTVMENSPLVSMALPTKVGVGHTWAEAESDEGLWLG